MKDKILHIRNKFLYYKNSAINKIESFFDSDNKFIIFLGKILNVLQYISRFMFIHLKKHKHIIIPISLLFIMPVISSLVFGYEFIGHSVNRVPTVIVNHDSSESVQNLIEQIKNNDAFNVVLYSSNDYDIKDYMDMGKAGAGILIPEHFTDDLLNGRSTKIMTFFDGSQTAVASAARGKISEVLGTIKSGYLIGLAEGKLNIPPDVAVGTIVPMGSNYRFLGNPARNMGALLNQGLLIIIIHLGTVIVAINIKEDKSYLKLFIKTCICGILSCLSTFIALYIQYRYFAFPFRGSFKAAAMLVIFCNIGMSFFGLILNNSKKGDKVAAIGSCGIVSSTMMMSGYTFPVVAMPKIFTSISKILPFTYLAMPLRDLSLVGGTVSDFIPQIKWLFYFMLIMWAVTFMMFYGDRLSANLKKKKEALKDKKNKDMEVIA